jgi:hypothetical protein
MALSPLSDRFMLLGIVQPLDLDVTQKNSHMGLTSVRHNYAIAKAGTSGKRDGFFGWWQ